MWLEGKRRYDAIKRLGRRESKKRAATTKKKAIDEYVKKLEKAFNFVCHFVNLFDCHNLNLETKLISKRFP